MKTRYTLLCFAAAMMMAGCSDDMMLETAGMTGSGEPLKADISKEGQPPTRALMMDNPGTKMTTRWTAGDQIGAFGSTGSNTLLSVAESDISDNGRTAYFHSMTGLPAGDLTVYYPYQSDATMSGGSLQLTFPDTQVYNATAPDAGSAVMAGHGTGQAGVTFRNVMAVLKIGQAFDRPTTLARVVFRDLSGAAVSGSYTLSWQDDEPTATFTDSGSHTLTLDCGSKGLQLDSAEVGVFYLVVPARHYAKGYEIAFVENDGQQTVKTVGTKNGKTLNRNIVYQVGAVGQTVNYENVSWTMAPGSVFMDDASMDKVVVTNTYYTFGRNTTYVGLGGERIELPSMAWTVDRSLGLTKGGYVVLPPSERFPLGYVGKVKELDDEIDGLHAKAVVEPSEDDPGAPFGNVTAGLPLYDEEGNLTDSQGIPLDITSNIISIKDASGEELDYEVSDDGSELLFSPEATEQMLTRAAEGIEKWDYTWTSKRLSHTFRKHEDGGFGKDADHASVTVGARLRLGMFVAMRMNDGELQFLHFKVNPQMLLDASLSIAAEGNIINDVDLRLLSLTLAPISIPAPPSPIILVPYVEIWATVGVTGAIELKASLTYKKDLGTFGFSYINGQGFTARHKANEPKKTDGFNLGEASIAGSVNVKTGLQFKTGISLVGGLMEAGLMTRPTLTTSLQLGLNYSRKDEESTNKPFELQTKAGISITPNIEIVPYSEFVSGRFHKEWKDYQIAIGFDPIYERAVWPEVKGTSPDGDRAYNSAVRVRPKWVQLPDTVSLGERERILVGYDGFDYDFETSGDLLFDVNVGIVIRTTGGKVEQLIPLGVHSKGTKQWKGSFEYTFQPKKRYHAYVVYYLNPLQCIEGCEQGAVGINVDTDDIWIELSPGYFYEDAGWVYFWPYKDQRDHAYPDRVYDYMRALGY